MGGTPAGRTPPQPVGRMTNDGGELPPTRAVGLGGHQFSDGHECPQALAAGKGLDQRGRLVAQSYAVLS